MERDRQWTNAGTDQSYVAADLPRPLPSERGEDANRILAGTCRERRHYDAMRISVISVGCDGGSMP